MKLYHLPLSPFSRKAHFAALLLGVDLDIQIVDLFAGQGQTPEFLRINPNGKVPALTDGDFSLWESNAIVQYLAKKAGNTTLLPADAASNADVLRWQFWETANWAPACAVYIFENVLRGMMGRGDPDAAELAKNDEKFHRFAKILNDHLADRAWLVGSGLTLADVSVAPLLMYGETAKYPLADYPNIRNWFGKIQQLPEWIATEPPKA